MPHEHDGRDSRFFVGQGLPFVGDQMVTARFAGGFCIYKNSVFGSSFCLRSVELRTIRSVMREIERVAIHVCSLWRQVQAGLGRLGCLQSVRGSNPQSQETVMHCATTELRLSSQTSVASFCQADCREWSRASTACRWLRVL